MEGKWQHAGSRPVEVVESGCSPCSAEATVSATFVCSALHGLVTRVLPPPASDGSAISTGSAINSSTKRMGSAAPSAGGSPAPATGSKAATPTGSGSANAATATTSAAGSPSAMSAKRQGCWGLLGPQGQLDSKGSFDCNQLTNVQGPVHETYCLSQCHTWYIKLGCKES